MVTNHRLTGRQMDRPTYVLGLTGAIGAGKSTLADSFRRLGGAVSAADDHVAALYQTSTELIDLIKLNTRAVFEGGVLRKDLLRDYFLDDPLFRRRMEAFIHPRVRAAHLRDIQGAKDSGVPLIVLDVPLLFESHMDDLCDGVLVLCCPRAIRRDRVLTRDGMTAALFDKINALQMGDDDKKKRATFWIDSSGGPLQTWRAVQEKLAFLCQTSKI